KRAVKTQNNNFFIILSPDYLFLFESAKSNLISTRQIKFNIRKTKCQQLKMPYSDFVFQRKKAGKNPASFLSLRKKSN
ncbi:MAG: hypothetical protein J6W73_08640, partial [Verrucomicrobia bacterium]|nr:hypothetical protein [Verrucomicrobiota bacterium]